MIQTYLAEQGLNYSSQSSIIKWTTTIITPYTVHRLTDQVGLCTEKQKLLFIILFLNFCSNVAYLFRAFFSSIYVRPNE